MKFLPLLLSIFLIVFTSCDPKVDQRAPRYNPAECPTCHDGTCILCHGDGKCQYCNGTGIRVSSTKNYTGEGIKLVDIKETCPFCHGTGKCPHCEGTGKCYECDGTHHVKDWKSGEEKYEKELNKKEVK